MARRTAKEYHAESDFLGHMMVLTLEQAGHVIFCSTSSGPSVSSTSPNTSIVPPQFRQQIKTSFSTLNSPHPHNNNVSPRVGNGISRGRILYQASSPRKNWVCFLSCLRLKCDDIN